MSHVDEGILHAVLDGALDALNDAGELPDGATAADVMEHLRTCADCRARLEAERAIREGAGVVLQGARIRDVDVPPFAGVPRAQRARRTRWVPLGWAASVVLAVGAGWWGSAAWRGTDASLDGAARDAVSAVQAETEQAPRAALEAVDDGHNNDFTEAGRAAADASAHLPAEMPATDAERAAVDRRPTGTVAAAAPAEVQTDAAIGSPAVRLPAPLGRPGVDSVRVAVSTPAAPPLVDAAAVARAGAAFSFRPGETRVLSDSGFAAPSPSALKQMFAAVSARAVRFDSILAREQSGRLAFAAVSAADRRRIEDQIFTAEDASAPSIEVARDRDSVTVRLRQTLRSGARIEFVTWQPEPAYAMNATGMALDAAVTSESRSEARSGAGERVELTTLPAVRRLRDGRNEIVLRDMSTSVWIALRADLGADDLRDLAQRLRRLQPQ